MSSMRSGQDGECDGVRVAVQRAVLSRRLRRQGRQRSPPHNPGRRQAVAPVLTGQWPAPAPIGAVQTATLASQPPG